MLDFLADIPLQAGELLDFNGKSLLCLGGLFLAGILLLGLIEKCTGIRKKGLLRFFFLTLYSFLCALAFYSNSNFQEKEKRLQWAETIAFDRDTLSENRFAPYARPLRQDQVIRQFLNGSRDKIRRDSLADYLRSSYFGPAFPDYQCFFTFCESDDILLIENQAASNCRAFFAQKAADGKPTDIPGLSVIDYGIEYYAYLYREQWVVGSDTLLLNAELGRKRFSDNPGGEGLHLPPAYSYAFYSEGELWSHNGDFLYAFTLHYRTPDSTEFRNWKQYSHLFYPLPKNRVLILSAPEPNPVDILYNFSLLFFLFGLCGAIVLTLTDKNFLGKAGSYAQRLRTSIFILVLSVFAVFGTTSILFIHRINENENIKALRNQSLSILAEMESRYLDLPADRLHDRFCHDSICASLHEDLEQLSNLFRNDIYLYSTDGRLLSATSSRSLLPDTLAPEIIGEMLEEQSHMLIKRRQFSREIGGLLAFTPFRNANNEILGFFCVPGYTQIDEWRSEMNRLLGAYLNIVVLLSLLSLLVTTLLARRITRPLSLVSRMVSQIRLTHKNEHLEWKRDDEIGTLIRQYNILVDELECSSRKLAESERENAWSEMARQVAHEIKNPLTPIKLQIQQLQRAYKDKRPDFDERLDRFAAMLTEQIDLLANIADTFSRFAKWQKPQMQTVAPARILQNIHTLFKADEKLNFRLEIPSGLSEKRISADPKFLEQILINLTRNAVQALEENGTSGNEPVIRMGIGIGEQKNEIMLYIADNGPGIALEKQERIFEPHFTTRTTGTGLGLAICRRLAESMNARISVKSRPGEGSCFMLFFPVLAQD